MESLAPEKLTTLRRIAMPALSRQILELAKTRGEITVKGIEESAGANHNTVKAHLRKLASDNDLAQVAKSECDLPQVAHIQVS